ncbi:MAG TPA: 16S rRNA (guanine(966)-N(2))-methyltransferase RsmD [Candidatus Saccharimonadales bacterium]|nr:16S rRNA (guanine(966)-N(2))-methyltransferase RsmD [Candidatus Saccharimonadales bacterium]
MRVIAGTLGGRTFNSPHGHRTHPMSDKIRGALFNALGDLSGLTVLDAFAGSGALSFEAVSRGAQSALAIESDRLAQRTIAENIKALGLNRIVKLIQASANAWLQTSQGQQFDVVLLDPPYDDVQDALLQRLTAAVKSDGILVVSWPGDQPAPEFEGFETVKERAYGDAQLIFYHRV